MSIFSSGKTGQSAGGLQGELQKLIEAGKSPSLEVSTINL